MIKSIMVKDIEILKIEKDSLVDFQNQCKSSNGKINIIVHPFYSVNTEKSDNGRYVTKEYLKLRDKYILECLESNIPIIFFQQDEDYNLLLSKLEGFGEHTVFTVRTRKGEETPMGGRKDWDRLANILHTSQVKLVTVSGLYLIKESIKQTKKEFDIKYDKEKIQIEFINNIGIYKEKFPNAREWLKEGFVPKGCVGFTIMNLLRYGIDVSIGSLTAPD